MNEYVQTSVLNADGDLACFDDLTVEGDKPDFETLFRYNRFRLRLGVPGSKGNASGEVVIYPTTLLNVFWAQEGGHAARLGRQILRSFSTMKGLERHRRRFRASPAASPATLYIETSEFQDGECTQRGELAYQIEPGKPWLIIVDFFRDGRAGRRPLRCFVVVAAEGAAVFAEGEAARRLQLAPTLFKSEWDALEADDAEAFSFAMARLAGQSIDGCEIRAPGLDRYLGGGRTATLPPTVASVGAIKCWHELIAHDNWRGPLFGFANGVDGNWNFIVEFARHKGPVARASAWRLAYILWAFKHRYERECCLEAIDAATMTDFRWFSRGMFGGIMFGGTRFEECFDDTMKIFRDLASDVLGPGQKAYQEILEIVLRNRALVEEECLENEIASGKARTETRL